jgi:hypothetical protein
MKEYKESQAEKLYSKFCFNINEYWKHYKIIINAIQSQQINNDIIELFKAQHFYVINIYCITITYFIHKKIHLTKYKQLQIDVQHKMEKVRQSVAQIKPYLLDNTIKKTTSQIKYIGL